MKLKKSMKVFQCVVEHSDGILEKSYQLAFHKKDVEGMLGEKGEIIQMKDVTSNFPVSFAKLHSALEKAGFGEIEVQLIEQSAKDNMHFVD